MAYIETEQAIAEIGKGDLLIGNNAEWAKEIIRRTPTADVVPRAEVERLLEDFQRTIRADAKVGMSAGEILLHIHNMLVELKKKYIGDKQRKEDEGK